MGNLESKCSEASITNEEEKEFCSKIFMILDEVVQKEPDKEQHVTDLKNRICKELCLQGDPKNKSLMISRGLLGRLLFDCTVKAEALFPSTITRIYLKDCSFDKNSESQLSKMILYNKFELVDLSKNPLDRSVIEIIRSSFDHPTLKVLILENTVKERVFVKEIVDEVINLVKYARGIREFRISPLTLDDESHNQILKGLEGNFSMSHIQIHKKYDKIYKSFVTLRNHITTSIYNGHILSKALSENSRPRISKYKSITREHLEMARSHSKGIISAEIPVNNQEVECMHNGLRYGCCTDPGLREYMEDFVLCEGDCPKEGAQLYAIFDGHGGVHAAEFVHKCIARDLRMNCRAFDISVEGQLQLAIEKVFTSIHADLSQWCIYTGTTACLAVINDGLLTVANVGDTRCVLCINGKHERISFDHKPTLGKEMEYIVKNGGSVSEGRLNGKLAVSRALGDGSMGKALNPRPDCYQIRLTKEHKFIIIASDGLWDCVSDEEAVEIVIRERVSDRAAMTLKDLSLKRGSTDNISILVIPLVTEFE